MIFIILKIVNIVQNIKILKNKYRIINKENRWAI